MYNSVKYPTGSQLEFSSGKQMKDYRSIKSIPMHAFASLQLQFCHIRGAH